MASFEEPESVQVVHNLEEGMRHPGLESNEDGGHFSHWSRILPKEHTSGENLEEETSLYSSLSSPPLEMRIFITSGKLEKVWLSEGEKSLSLLAKIFS